MAKAKQKKQGLGLFFWVSFITAIAIMFGLMFQTAMLVKTAKADETTDYNLEDFASDFDFVKYSYMLNIEFAHGDDFSEYGSCTNTITSCCDEVVPYIKDGDTVTIKREPCCYDYDVNGQMIVEDWNFDLLEISYLPVINGVSYNGGECGNCDTILIYVRDFNATEIVLDISTFENFEVAILDIDFYQKAQLKNGEVQYGKYYYFAESSFYPFSMKPCGNYVRIFTDFWSLTYSGDSAYAYGCAHGLYNGTLDSFNELYGNTTLTTNTALNKTNIEYPSNINEDEEKYYFQTGFLSTYINAYNNITLRYYCNMYDETTESIKTYRNLSFYYLKADESESENSGNSSDNGSIEKPETSVDGSTDDSLDGGNENDTKIVVAIFDHNREYISQFAVEKGALISLDDIKTACGGVLLCEQWDFFVPTTLASGKFKFEYPIEQSINLYARMCEVTLRDLDESVFGVIKVEYKKTISLDDIKTACGGVLPYERWEFIKREYDFSKEVIVDFDLYPLNHDVYVVLNEETDDDIGFLGHTRVYDNEKISVERLRDLVSDDYKNFKVVTSMVETDDGISFINLEKTPITGDVYTFVEMVNDVQTPTNSTNPTTSDNLIENSSGTVEISGSNGYTGPPQLGDGDNGHDFQFKPIKFPCKDCGISLWTYLWQAYKVWVILAIAVILLGVAIWVVSRFKA